MNRKAYLKTKYANRRHFVFGVTLFLHLKHFFLWFYKMFTVFFCILFTLRSSVVIMDAGQSAQSKRVYCNKISDLVKSLKCNSSAYEHHVLAKMKFNKSIKNMPVLPGVTRLSILDSEIKNYSILRFDQWCPNVTELAFIRVKLSERVYEIFTGGEHKLPAVKSLTYHFEGYMETFGDFIGEMDEKFPSLESLTLILIASDPEELEPMWDDEKPYDPIYFQNLKKLSLTAYGDEGDRVFDYMDISNENLEELSFTGMYFTKDNLKWIKGCEKVSKLTLGCPCLEEGDLKPLKGMQNLEELHLDVDKIEMTPNEMIEIIRKNGQLKLLSIKCEHNNKLMKFDDEFKKRFDALVEKRGNVVMKVTFGSGDTMRQMTISESGLDEITPLVDVDTDEDSDEDDYYDFYDESGDDSSSWEDMDSDSSSEEEDEEDEENEEQ